MKERLYPIHPIIVYLQTIDYTVQFVDNAKTLYFTE